MFVGMFFLFFKSCFRGGGDFETPPFGSRFHVAVCLLLLTPETDKTEIN